MKRIFVIFFSLLFLISLIFLLFFSKPFALGMDLVGGTLLTYQADLKDISKDKIKSALEQTKDLIERRINFLGVSEFFVSYSSDGKILVEIPNIKDPESAIKIIGETPVLEFAYPEGDKFIKTKLTGRNVKRAEVEINPQTLEPVVLLYFDEEGTKIFKELTEKYLGKPIAIYLDNQIISAPTVREVIENGQAQITGDFTLESAKILAQRLNQGALPVPLKLIGASVVNPLLGEKFLNLAIKGSVLGIILVMIFMVLFYGFNGLLASLALIFFTSFNLALYKILGVTISLASLSGLILTVGMAVDANILIFERMKEEKRKGLKKSEAVTEGYKRAFPSIRDSNITTILSALLIYFLATSFVKGFALTLFFGVSLSFLTAVFFTHFLLEEIYKDVHQT